MPCDCAPECAGKQGEECRRCCIIWNGITAIRGALNSAPNSREKSLSLTKLQELGMWVKETKLADESPAG
jgi:hypothetical protein